MKKMSKQMRLNFMFNCVGKLFISGTLAKGALKVYTLNETKIKRIKIGIIGKITIEADDNENSTTVEHGFYCSEEHIFTSSDLLTNEEYDEQVLEYAVPLANNLPPSIVLDEGSIIYYLYATMEEEFADGTTQNVNTEAVVSVATIVNCNTIPKAAKDKVVNSGSPVNSCICLQRQESDNTLQISPRAYVPGDCIKINAEVFNAHSTPICYVQVALIQKVKLKFEEWSKKVKRVVSETKHGVLMPNQLQVWRDEMLRIPPLPCTTYHKHIQITYKVQLITAREATGRTVTPLLEVPVVIGNLPLDSTLVHLTPLSRCEFFRNKLLPIPEPYQDYAQGENGIQSNERSKFVPSYITYMSEHAMENVELQ